MRELIAVIAKALVDEPDQVQISETQANELLILELQVAKPDIGKIIGKQGRTARAIRTVLQASAAKLGKRATLEIIDQ